MIICSLKEMTRLIFARFLLLSTFGWAAASHGAPGRGLDWPADRLLPSFSPPAPVIDCIDLSSVSGAEVDLFTSLEGIVNRTRPSLACVNDNLAEGKFTWLDLHHLPHDLIGGYDAVAKYKDRVTGLVVTDPQQPATLNLATTIAGLKDELICDTSLLPTLTNPPCHLAIKDDLRGRFSSRLAVYDDLYKNYWPQCTHRVIAGLSPRMHGELRDYLISLKAAVVWLAPGPAGEETAILSRFLADMTPAHGVYLGWWWSESDGLGWIGRYGIPVLASDFFNNASVFGGVRCPLEKPATPPPPPLENKIYVSLILSDGDNVQYMQHHLKQWWNDPARGSVPLGWTVSPLAVDIDPGMLDFYQRTATPDDCLVSGPSGAGYARLNYWPSAAHLTAFTKVSDSYLRRSGLQIITVWNRVTEAAANSFASNCPTLLGLTDQGGGTYVSLHAGLPTIGFAAHANYARNGDEILHSIAGATKNWQGAAPLFIAVQGDAWYVTPTDCRKIADSLDKSKFVVVRPDHLFLLCRQQAGRPNATVSRPSDN